jgi:hypothetical protein
MSKPLIYELKADVSLAELYLQDIQRRMVLNDETFDEEKVREDALKLVKVELVIK